ncbi:sulfotransferase [Bradyrhizobium sp.]|uniref:sulfotransferase n=1 Tax=Bradyrhizobium sp. TaxID=376 RepID=UPI003C1CFF99
MAPPKQDDPRADCSCGSGLKADRCCALDWTASWPQAAQALDGARNALVAGRDAEAERLLVDILEREPNHLRGLMLLCEICTAQNRTAPTEALLARIVRLDPNHLIANQRLALLLFGKGLLVQAENYARNAVRIAPNDAQSHNLMGMIMTEAQRPQVGEYHYRRARELLREPSAILLANLAWNLKNQGRMAEARLLYQEAVGLDPTIFQTLYGWAQMEETDRDFARAGELLDAAERLSPRNPNVLLQRAVLHGRVGDYDKALAAIDEIEQRRDGGGLGPIEWSEKGRLLDRMGRYAEAFAAFSEAKRTLRARTGRTYQAEEAKALVRRLTRFFVAARLQILPRAGVRTDVAQPIFIVGFPRSGTTMIEQMLSAHPRIAAGDELPVINELTGLLPRMLNSPLSYPDALAELWFGDQAEGLENLRDYYLQRARQLGALRRTADWFTDKMPLNETHLGLIGLVFPQAPIIHLLRHPLDAVLSTFSNHLTHGFYCAYDLTSIALHYVLVMELVEHYRREMALRYLSVKYEDVIVGQETMVREMLGFIGAPYDPRCLDFHENRRYARTASYAQVTEQLYDRSRFRYRAYREQLAPVIPILEPIIHRLGYTIDH